MIVTITPNPSIDRTLQVPSVRRGEVIRVRAASSEAGGKGINESRALAVMGVPTIAVAPASPATRARLDDLLDGSTSLRTVPIDGDIRVNLSLVEPDGTVTKVNEPGPTLSEREATAFLEAVVELILDALAAPARAGAGADGASPSNDPWVVGCGSLPPGLPDPFYASLAARLPPAVRVAVDADRSALRAVVRTPIALLKPNRAELEEVMGRPLPTLGDVADAAAELVAGGAERVLVSLGPDGASSSTEPAPSMPRRRSTTWRTLSVRATRCSPASWPEARQRRLSRPRSPGPSPPAGRRERGCRPSLAATGRRSSSGRPSTGPGGSPSDRPAADAHRGRAGSTGRHPRPLEGAPSGRAARPTPDRGRRCGRGDRTAPGGGQ